MQVELQSVSTFLHVPNLWPAAEVAKATGGTASGVGGVDEQSPPFTRVVVDSRHTEPGDLFIALPGDPGARFNPSHRSQRDGHDFVAQALAAGARGAMLHKPIDLSHSLAQDATPPEFITVDDTYDGLWDLAQFARTRLQGSICAVTGSNGKTTAKTFLQYALNGYAPPGSFNNHIGVPLTLVNAPVDAKYCIFEIGTNHPGEIYPLASLVKPHFALLLNVHAAHIENFASWEDLRKEKVSIFNSLESNSNAVSDAELNLDFGKHFGLNRDCDAYVIDLQGDLAEINVCGEILKVRVPGGGIHRAKTLTAVALVCKLMDAALDRVQQLPVDLVPPGRGNRYTVSGVGVTDDSYNANPASMQAALSAHLLTYSQQKRRCVAVVGEMLELGEQSNQAHLALAETLKQYDAVVCVGQATTQLAAQLGCEWYAQTDDSLITAVTQILSAGDEALIKGSNRVFWQNNFVAALCAKLDGA